MTRLPALVALVPVLLLSGCFQLRALLRVADDGSGTLEETVLFGEMMRELMGASGEQPSVSSLYNVDSLRAHASRLGDGVTLVRVDSVATPEGFGYRVTYAVEDVGDLRFRFNPNPVHEPNRSSRNPGAGSMLAATTPELAVTFDRDATGALVVRMPHLAPARPAAEPPRAAVTALADSLRRQMEGGAAAASEFLEGIRMSLEIVGDGPVAATDASFPTDSSVVLFDYSMGGLVGLMRDKPELVARVQLEDRAGDPDTRPVIRAFAARPGVRYELSPEVTVRFAR